MRRQAYDSVSDEAWLVVEERGQVIPAEGESLDALLAQDDLVIESGIVCSGVERGRVMRARIACAGGEPGGLGGGGDLFPEPQRADGGIEGRGRRRLL